MQHTNCIKTLMCLGLSVVPPYPLRSRSDCLTVFVGEKSEGSRSDLGEAWGRRPRKETFEFFFYN